VGVVFATVVATDVVVEAGGLVVTTAACTCGRVVVVARVDVVVVAGTVVVGAEVVVSSTRAVDDVEESALAAAPVRRMVGSLLRWGIPAMATPTPAHTTSMSTVIVRCPGRPRCPRCPFTGRPYVCASLACWTVAALAGCDVYS